MPIFPHISRKFTAPPSFSSLGWLGAGFRWAVLTSFLVMNALFVYQRDTNHWNTLVQVLGHPGEMDPHIALARAFWADRYLTPAMSELNLANELLHIKKETNTVLGVTTPSPTELSEQWQNARTRMTNQYAFWQTVVAQKPDYRDAYLLLAGVGYELGHTDEAKQSWEKAKTIDPNSPEVVKLESLLSR